MKPHPALAFAFAALVSTAPFAAAQTPGVSKTEILVGTIQDLSGPVAAYGKQTRSGMQLRVDELNEQGGINGRKIRLLVEDNAYDPKRSVLAGEKLVNQDKIFILAGHLGSAHNNAVMPMQFEKGVTNFFPLSSDRSMNMDYVEKTSYKRGATDFSSQVARMKSAGCELVVMGTIIRETMGTLNEGKKIGFTPVMLGHNGTYTELIPKLGGAAMNRL